MTILRNNKEKKNKRPRTEFRGHPGLGKGDHAGGKTEE
jgi:hypothetical protein